MKRNGLLKKLNGFQKAQRERFLLLKSHVLTLEEFVLYELGVAIVDWDEDHDTYGSFKATNKELSDILGWKSDTTVLRHKGELIKKGYFIPKEDGWISPLNFNNWQLRKNWTAKPQSKPAETQPPTANIQSKPAETQTISTQKYIYPLVSSKGNSGFLRSDNEYLNIWNEMGRPQDFQIDDMKWIDQNVKEDSVVPN